MKEGMTVHTSNNTKGLARAFDVRTGKLIWAFNTIPKPGEVGNETWLNNSWAINGNTGVWTQITVDEELGLVYLPVEDPTSDYYGGKRPGANLFGESLVCVDLATGKRKWHFQFAHHPIWDHDISSAPIMADVVVDGRPRKVVAVPTKQAWLFVFDRVTGDPIWPIEEKSVPQGDVPGEWYSPTQPHPPAALMYGHNSVHFPDDLIDFTPELRAQAEQQIKRYRYYNDVVYNPPMVGNVNGILGAITMGAANGGTNWPGGGYDPETHTVFVQAATASIAAESVAPPPEGFSDMAYQAGVVGQEFRERLAAGAGTYADAVTPSSGRGAGGGGRGPREWRRGSSGRCHSRTGRIGWTRWARRRGRRRTDRSGAVYYQAAVRSARRHRSRSRKDPLARAARRHAGRRQKRPDAEGDDHPEDRAERQRGSRGDQDTGHSRRRAVHDDRRPSARRHAARLRQGDGQASRRDLHARSAERVADDL
jgi:hypothetical protein